ncbi:MAG: glycosyltransferase family 2 protein [Phormidesmis sp.]
MGSVTVDEQTADEQTADEQTADEQTASVESVEGFLKSPVDFSIIIETENLASADLPGLFRSLNALQRQTLSPLLANEVLMVETGDVPEKVLATIRDRYPWIKTQRIDADLEYYQAKMQGIALTSGEVVVLCDSDCVYNDGWLAAMLQPYAEEKVQFLAGETSLAVDGPYGLAMALVYIFPRYTGRDSLAATGGYFCNNVSFRRSLIDRFPIPGTLPMYRGNCVIHAHQLAANSKQIWQQPEARALHAPPNGLSHFVSRFLMLGYDGLCVSRFAANPTELSMEAPMRPLRDLAVAGMLLANKLKTAAVRLAQVLREDIRYGLYLPLALPICAAALALYTVGLALAYARPAYWLNNRDRLEALLEHS